MDFSATKLDVANLRGAILTNSDLSKASLRNANLREATFDGATLEDTDFRGADLREAQLDSAKCVHTADFTAASFRDTTLGPFEDVDELFDVVDESQLDVGTILNSVRRIPARLIESGAGTLGENYGRFHTCFLCYATEDREFVDRLYGDLRRRGVRCWYAPDSMRAGDILDPTIETAIWERDRFILILSEQSITKAWVSREVRTALQKEKSLGVVVIVPVRIDDVVMTCTEQWAHDIRRIRYIGDFTGWRDNVMYEVALGRLLSDLTV